jgi:hypothetical protein
MFIELGKNYTDKITGFNGVATGWVTYISGCNQVLLQPRVNDKNEVADGRWYDEQRLEENASYGKITLINDTNGFDQSPPLR